MLIIKRNIKHHNFKSIPMKLLFFIVIIWVTKTLRIGYKRHNNTTINGDKNSVHNRS